MAGSFPNFFAHFISLKNYIVGPIHKRNKDDSKFMLSFYKNINYLQTINVFILFNGIGMR